MAWIITGASRGLGRALALQLVARGQQVLACARDAAALASLRAQAPEQIQTFVMDLSDAQSIAPAFAGMLDGLGDAPLQGLVNNAGIGHYKPFVEHSEAEALQILQVNLNAAVQASHAVLPRLLAQGRGHIVNIASDLARRPLANMAVYVASKHGLAGFSHSLLREVKGRGVKVSLVNPGIIDTAFGGGSEGSRDESWSLRPAQLATLIAQMLLDQPAHLIIDELNVHPLGQDF
jgi:short-subunit dehydrogenase